MAAAVVATAYGGPEVLRLVDAPTAAPGPGEVLLDVRAAGTNPVDYKSYSGAFSRDPAALPMRLGLEASGMVTAVGQNAAGPAGPIAVGDEVVAYRIQGAYASQVVVPAEAVVPKPPALSFEEAGGLLLAGATAVHCVSAAAITAGETVVIHGAAGGVGLMAVQLARIAGVRVVATASESRHAYLRELGAEPVTYGPGLLERIRSLAPVGVAAAIDTAGTDEAIDVSLALVADYHRVVSIAAVRRGFAEGIRVLGGAPGADPGTEIRAAARLELVRLAEARRLRVRVAATVPLTEVAEAHRLVARGHTFGKIVLVP
ncbi:MAG TPA: NADP-dependent oxidoreductase [Actinomycetota bacterium]|nr:NADP-dependent oxidoreductase [Actinomycetota bacterium]